VNFIHNKLGTLATLALKISTNQQLCTGNVNSIHNKWELTFRIETNFGALASVLQGLATQIDQHSQTINKFGQRKIDE
jgi:hypothetical protein